MRRLAPIVILNLTGLVLFGWGLAMAIGLYPIFQPSTVAAILLFGLLLIAGSTAWVAVLMLRSNKSKVVGVGTDRSNMTPAPNVLPNREQLLRAIDHLHELALIVIELRREIYRLNTQESYYVHRQETAAELEATKQYREAKTILERELAAVPEQVWLPIDNFCVAIEQSLTQAAYSLPGDWGVHASLSHHRELTIQQIERTASGSKDQ